MVPEEGGVTPSAGLSPGAPHSPEGTSPWAAVQDGSSLILLPMLGCRLSALDGLVTVCGRKGDSFWFTP